MSTAPKYRKADYNEGHPATLPIAENTPLPDPTTFGDPNFFRLMHPSTLKKPSISNARGLSSNAVSFPGPMRSRR